MTSWIILIIGSVPQYSTYRSLLHNLVLQILNSGQVRILLAVYKRSTMVRISGNGLSQKLVAAPFVGPLFCKNNSSSSPSSSSKLQIILLHQLGVVERASHTQSTLNNKSAISTICYIILIFLQVDHTQEISIAILTGYEQFCQASQKKSR